MAEAARADLYETKPQTPYTDTDLNWMDKKSRSSVETSDKSLCPALADTNAYISDHDVIFLNQLVGTIAPPLAFFLMKYKPTGKLVAPF